MIHSNRILLGAIAWGVARLVVPGTHAEAREPNTTPVVSGAAADAADTNASWRQDPIWDDGLAEFSVYEVDWKHYNRSWKATATLIAVKENWAPDLDVKADHVRSDGFDVIKFNHIRDAATGIYSYHQSASIFVRRDDGALRKITTTSSEACGISTASLHGDRLTSRSYFDGQGERKSTWPRSAVPRDGLPLTLRAFVAGALPASIKIYPELMTGRFAEHGADTFKLARSAQHSVEVPAGTFTGVTLSLRKGESVDTYVFDAESPHTLLSMRLSDGTEYRLAKTERIAYWGLNRPGDEAWHPDSVRDR